MVLGNESLEMVQGYTQNREDLLYALDHVPAALPYKMMNGSFILSALGNRSTRCNRLRCKIRVYQGERT